MPRYLVGRGTLLNAATVAGGALLGLLLGKAIPLEAKTLAIAGIGLCNLGMGLKMFLETRNVLIVVASVVLGGLLGYELGLEDGIAALADGARGALGAGGSGTFQEAVISTFVLFCVGPMTLLGCLQDGLEDKIELLAIKSTMDGISALFFAAALGPGVLVTAALVLVFQGALTLAASSLRKLVEDRALLAEITAVGGVLMLGIGLRLLQVKLLPMADYLPALAFAPLLAALARRVGAKGTGPAREKEFPSVREN